MTAWELIERRRKRYVARHAGKFRKALHAQIIPILDEINITFVDQFEIAVPLLIKPANVKDAFIELYQDVGLGFKNSLEMSLKSRSIQYKSLENDIWTEEMKAYAELVLGTRVELMTDTTRKLILEIMRQSIRESTDLGYGVEKIASKIRNDLLEKYGKYEKWRARRIAQTETISASNYSSYKAASESGVALRKRWLLAPAGIAKTERHRLITGLENQRPFMNEPFLVDGDLLKYPGDHSGRADNIINCRCALGYETL